MRILYLVPYTPNLIRVRPYNLIRGLAARGHVVTVATLWSSPQEQADLLALREAGVEVIAAPLPRRRALWNCLRALPTRTPLQAVYCWQPALVEAVGSRQLSEGGDRPFDVVHVEHLRGANYGLRTVHLGLPTVWDSVDCITYLFEQAARQSRSAFGRLMARLELGRTRRYEGWLVGQFDRVLVTSAVDKAALESLTTVGGRRSAVEVLPNGVDLDYFCPADESRDPATLVFTGKMSYHANVTAALHLINDIMPLVWRERPDVRVIIAGKDPPRVIQDLIPPDASRLTHDASRITVTGAVPDLRPYLRRATLAVAPMAYGAGIQNKVLEAMACGTPVVASRQAVAALAARPDRELIVAEGADAFARAIVMLLDDTARRAELSRAGRAYVETHHDWNRIAGKLEAIYADVLRSRQA